MKYIIVFLKVVMTIIIGQTLFFKFSAAEESVYIFTTLGIEPWGRITLGILELLSIILLWIPATVLWALLLIFGMMSGAIASHLLFLGVQIMGDGGELFILAIITWLSSVFLLLTKRVELRGLIVSFL